MPAEHSRPNVRFGENLSKVYDNPMSHLLFLGVLVFIGLLSGYAHLYEIALQVAGFFWLLTAVLANDEIKSNKWPPLAAYRRTLVLEAVENGAVSSAFLLVTLTLLSGLLLGTLTLTFQSWEELLNREIKEIIVDVILVGPVFLRLCTVLHEAFQELEAKRKKAHEEGPFGMGDTGNPAIDGTYKVLSGTGIAIQGFFVHLLYLLYYLFPILIGYVIGLIFSFLEIEIPLLMQFRDLNLLPVVEQ